MRSRRGKSLIGHSCFQLCLLGSSLWLLITPCPQRQVKHVSGETGLTSGRVGGGKGGGGGAGKERRMLIQPPHHVKCPNSPAGTPSFCQMKMVLKPLFVQMEDRWVGLGNGIHHSAGTEPWEGLWICCSGYCRDGRPHKQVACACKEPYEGSVVSRSLIFSIMVAEVLVCQGISHTKWVNILV